MDPPAHLDANKHSLCIPKPTPIYLDAAASFFLLYHQLGDIDPNWTSSENNLTIGVLDKDATRPKPKRIKPEKQVHTKKEAVGNDQILVNFYFGGKLNNSRLFFDPGKPAIHSSSKLTRRIMDLPLARPDLVEAASAILHANSGISDSMMMKDKQTHND